MKLHFHREDAKAAKNSEKNFLEQLLAFAFLRALRVFAVKTAFVG
jgi:hypothetical protein